ncbi:MAG: hypothetical protein ING44_14295 [Telmatospirillum sp.]|nr:hypothetical protein [Telmatospirillum sp.]
MSDPQSMFDDRPISDASQDRFGFAVPAKHLAKSLLAMASSDGSVLGVEGDWGTGKSSFVNLVASALRNQKSPPEIVHFRPWMIDSRDGLLDELFREIENAVAKIEPKELTHAERLEYVGVFGRIKKSIHNRRRKGLNPKLRKSLALFRLTLGAAGKVAEIGAALDVPLTRQAEKLFKVSEKAISGNKQLPSLDKQKETLTASLRKLSRPIVVFIDDLDRLEPAEAALVMRLIRAIADFPNIVYVLSYARPLLVSRIKEALKIDDGEEFLEKILQVFYTVPRPEDFDLRRLFQEKIVEALPTEFESLSNAERRAAQSRVLLAIDQAGGRVLKTPRDVFRALNLVKLNITPVIGDIDLGDMIWLQLVSLKNREIYSWIESYMTVVASLVSGGMLAPGEERLHMQNLEKALEQDALIRDVLLAEMRTIIPGISRGLGDDSEDGNTSWQLFNEVKQRDLHSRSISEKRLGSPQHYKIYFAFSRPANSVSDNEFTQFLRLLNENHVIAAEMFDQFVAATRPQGGLKVEALMDRFSGEVVSTLNPKSARGLAICLSNSMDKAVRLTGVQDFGINFFAARMAKLLPTILRRIHEPERNEAIIAIFKNGAAIGWLSQLLRDEILEEGSRKTPQADGSVLTYAEDLRQAVKDVMRARYNAAPVQELLCAPEFPRLLIAWYEIDVESKAETRMWAARLVASDAGFIDFMEKMRTWSATNEIVRWILRRDTIGMFLDFEEAKSRLQSIASDTKNPMNERAVRLIEESVRTRE